MLRKILIKGVNRRLVFDWIKNLKRSYKFKKWNHDICFKLLSAQNGDHLFLLGFHEENWKSIFRMPNKVTRSLIFIGSIVRTFHGRLVCFDWPEKSTVLENSFLSLEKKPTIFGGKKVCKNAKVSLLARAEKN